MNTTFGYVEFTYTRKQLEHLEYLLQMNGDIEEALRMAMTERDLWEHYRPEDRAYWILHHLRKIESNGGKLLWPEMTDTISTVVTTNEVPKP